MQFSLRAPEAAQLIYIKPAQNVIYEVKREQKKKGFTEFGHGAWARRK